MIMGERAEGALEFLESNYGVLGTALAVYAEHMEKAADETREAYEAGRSDPAVLAAQNGSLITNNGYKHMAGMFEESAARAREASEQLNILLDEEEE